MNISRIIRRSFEITRDYRALWLFGFILALTTPGGGGGNGGGSSSGGGGSFTAPAGLASKINLSLGQMDDGAMVALAVGMAILALLVTAIFTIARVVAETAMIRMVDGYEATGARVSVSQGFRLGWSRGALRIFLIDLLVGLAAMLGVALLLGIAAAPLLLWTLDIEVLGILGTVFAILLGIPALILIVVGIIGLVILVQFFHRAAVLEERGAIESLHRGWQVARQRLGQTFLLGVTLFAIGLVITLALLPLFFLLLVIGGTLAGLPGLLAGLLTSLFAQGAAPWVVGLILALPIFTTVVIAPALFASGLVQVFSSSAWTLAYRELLAGPAVLPETAA